MVTAVRDPLLTRYNIVCPVVRLDHARRKDKSISLFIAIGLHFAVFAAAAVVFIKPPQFSIDDKGSGGIEISLMEEPIEVPASPEPVPEMIEEPVIETKSDFVIKIPLQEPVQQIVKPVEPPPPPVQKEIKVERKDKMTVQSTGGALTEAKPDYLKNPAPEYPAKAKRQGVQGLVLLTVRVGKDGRPLNIAVKNSSGHSSLDDSAVKAVWKWLFQPAKLGNMPVETTVEVPIRFRLTD